MSEERISRHRWLTEQLYARCAEEMIPLNPFMAMEAISSTALEHPEWDMDEMRTREEWSRAEPGP